MAMKPWLPGFPRFRAGTGAASSAASEDEPLPLEGQVRNGLAKFLAALLERRMRWIPWLTLAIGFGSATGAGLWMAQEVERKARSDFAVLANDVANDLESRFGPTAMSPIDTRAHAREGPKSVSPRSFTVSSRPLAILERYRLANISYISRASRGRANI